MAQSADNAPVRAFDVHSTSASSEWLRWKRAVDLYLIAKNITSDDQKQATILSLGGMDLQDIFYAIPNHDVVPQGKTKYSHTIDLLDQFFVPKFNSNYERHVLRQCKQQPGESTEMFINRLRRQAAKCEFDNVDAAICEQVIDGCTDPNLREKYLSQDVLTVSYILKKAKSREAVTSQMSAYHLPQPQAQAVAEEASSTSTINRIHTPRVRTSNRQYASQNTNASQNACYRCGATTHTAQDEKCPAKDKECNYCHKIGHFKSACRKRSYNASKRTSGSAINTTKSVNLVEQKDNENESSDDDNYVFTVTSKVRKNEFHCDVGGVVQGFIIDSGADDNLIPKEDWNILKSKHIKVISQTPASETDKKLIAYAQTSPLKIAGTFVAKISYGDSSCNAKFVVIENEGATALLGRDTLMQLNVIKLMAPVNFIQSDNVISETRPVFQGIGKLKNYEVELKINDAVQPKRQKLRPIPVNLQHKVDAELDNLLKNDIIEPVNEPSTWVSNIVISLRGDKTRICVDMRDANEAIETQHYPFPTMDDIRPKIRKAKVFAKLDMNCAYNQFVMKKKFRHISTFITHRGLFRYTRLFFGITSAPNEFQSVLERILRRKRAVNFLDDIFLFATNPEELRALLIEVLDLLESNGLTLNYKKCVFFATEIDFIGYRITCQGILIQPDKILKIENFRAPVTKDELHSFLGLINFVAKFIPMYSEKTEPLRKLLRKNAKFEWGKDQIRAFNTLKEALVNITCLHHFNTDLETHLYCDAGPNALGAVLVQISNGEPRPIEFASKSLTEVEKRYSQLEKEAYALVWGVERFQFYLLGKRFKLITDNQPVKFLFAPGKFQQNSRIQRWSLRLQTFDYELVHKSGKNNIADPLSRLIINTPSSSTDRVESQILHIAKINAPKAIPLQKIIDESIVDEELKLVIACIQAGATDSLPMAYRAVANELAVWNGMVLRGDRLVIPTTLRKDVVKLAHEGHPGIVKTKERLRTKVWWPNMHKDAESAVKLCVACQAVSSTLPTEPMTRRTLPEAPWEQLSYDFLGPLPSGDYIFAIIDNYSRFYEIKITKSINSKFIIASFQEIFARYGIPLIIISDNAPQNKSDELLEFYSLHGVQPHFSIPFWPQSNGEIERQNRSLVKILKTAQIEQRDWREELYKFLLMQRTTPNATTGISPADMLFKYSPRDKIPSIRQKLMLDSDVRDRDNLNKFKGKLYADSHRGAESREPFIEGTKVLVKSTDTGKLTSTFDPNPGTVKESQGSKVTVEKDGRLYVRNSAHLREFHQPTEEDEPIPNDHRSVDISQTPERVSLSAKAIAGTTRSPEPAIVSARPRRQINPPKKLNDYVVNSIKKGGRL
ncbi:uncharacterized protein K02A2.6-like [Planococcus citri]|uniref:uncharacterized protein K02A2.6-like n=1 Tax=Planococcus citri TaxID=170843 RepID=UPI0031F8988A